MLRIKGIECDGELGQFRANVNMMGWKGDETGDAQIHETQTVKRAEYLEGKLRVACQEDGDEEETVLGLKGFNNSDFDSLAQYFQDYCGVTVKRHYPAEAQAAAAEEPIVDKRARSPSPERRQLTNSFGLVNETHCSILDDDLVEQEDPSDKMMEAIYNDEAYLDEMKRTGDGGYTAPAAPTTSVQATSKTPTSQPEGQSWMQCKSCTFINTEYDAKCQMCEGPLEGADTAVWNCSKCTLENPLTTFSCEACGTVRPNSRRAPTAGVGNPNNQIALVNPRKWQGQSRMDDCMARQECDDGEGDDSPGGWGTTDRAISARSATAARTGARQLRQELLDSCSHEAERPERSRANYMRDDSIMEGWVWKESRVMKRFRKRWMILSNDSVEWIARAENNGGGPILNVHLIEKMKREKSEATETIQIRDMHNIYDDDASAPGVKKFAKHGGKCFCLDAGRKTITMICDYAWDKEEWMTKLKAARNPN